VTDPVVCVPKFPVMLKLNTGEIPDALFDIGVIVAGP
jgi:hypothetical protein